MFDELRRAGVSHARRFEPDGVVAVGAVPESLGRVLADAVVGDLTGDRLRLREELRDGQAREHAAPQNRAHSSVGIQSVTQDDDGRWYLFYARDFLDSSNNVRPGTALMVAPMKSMTELQDEGRTALRARSNWQRFRANRLMYGRNWDWHTLEGPCVCKHDGRYYCFYSGGCWQNDSYGVDYGVADHIMGPYSDAGNESGPRVLKTVPNHVIGPGHNSIIRGPDGETDYIVYHAWDKQMKLRRMFIDELSWTSDGPRCQGPTYTE